MRVHLKILLPALPEALGRRELFGWQSTKIGAGPNVVFPCAALTDPPAGRMAIYYGGADSVTCLAFALIDGLIDFVKGGAVQTMGKAVSCVAGCRSAPESYGEAVGRPATGMRVMIRRETLVDRE